MHLFSFKVEQYGDGGECAMAMCAELCISSSKIDGILEFAQRNRHNVRVDLALESCSVVALLFIVSVARWCRMYENNKKSS